MRSFFDRPRLQSELAQLTEESSRPDFWNDPQNAQTVLRRLAALKDQTERLEKLEKELTELGELEQLFGRGDDPAAQKELAEHIAKTERDLEALEERAMFRSPEDMRPAILSIHPGAGGVESCDWAAMLFRMYTRYIELQGLAYRVLDYQPNEEAGIKEATLEVTGDYAYGLLKSEMGVHRLVR
ncbi:MAG: PCRF domain-containing protein, partial [candidate division WOR-3 bacterium]